MIDSVTAISPTDAATVIAWKTIRTASCIFQRTETRNYNCLSTIRWHIKPASVFTFFCLQSIVIYSYWFLTQWLVLRRPLVVWRSRNGIDHININQVKLRRARLVLGLVTSIGRSNILYLSKLLWSTQPGHPSVCWCNDCTEDGFDRCWGINGEY